MRTYIRTSSTSVVDLNLKMIDRLSRTVVLFRSVIDNNSKYLKKKKTHECKR